MAENLENATLYVRGLNKPSEEIEDVWDDTVLNSAYDRALKMANEEVAKRIAMETNSKKKEDGKKNTAKAKPKTKKEKATKAATSKEEPEWKPGMPCRAIYEEDGLEYEAFLVKIIDDEDCIVKFLGYDNSEKVPISTLTPTLGDQERMRQLEIALGERADDGFESQPASESVEAASDGISSPEPTERPRNKKKKANKKKKNHSTGSEFELPALPMPTMNMFRNMGGVDMPMPPPPPLASLSDRTDAEEQAISDMLLSWYMTGYYTGLYQGLKRQRQPRRYN